MTPQRRVPGGFVYVWVSPLVRRRCDTRRDTADYLGPMTKFRIKPRDTAPDVTQMSVTERAALDPEFAARLKQVHADSAARSRAAENKWLGPGLDRLPSGAIRYRYRDAQGVQRTGRVESPTYKVKRHGADDVKARDEARRLLAAAKGEVASGVAVAVVKDKVADYARTWNQSRPTRTTSQKARASNLRLLERSPLGSVPIQSVKPSQVQQWVKWMIDEGHGPSTVRQRYKWLSSVFRSAVDDQVIRQSPCVRISLPEVARDTSEPLTLDQVRSLADAIEPRYQFAVLLQAGCGLRVSELLGLTPECIDTESMTVAVTHQRAADGSLTDLKTSASKRTLPFPAGLLDPFKAHTDTFVKGAPLFPNIKGGSTSKDTYNREFRRAVEACDDVPDETTTHDLRHHYGAVLLLANVPVNTVARMMGHQDATTLLRVYARVLDQSKDLVRNALDNLWG